MALLLKSGAVFLHIPKTGGTWVRRILRDAGLVRCRFSHKHADMQRVMNSPECYRKQHFKRSLQYGWNWHKPVANAYKFCFVRHPLDWYRSWWKFMAMLDWPRFAKMQRDGTREWHPTAELEEVVARSAGAGIRFDEFARCTAASEPGYVSRLFESYATPDIDFVGRQENLVDDLITVLVELGEKFDKDRIRKASRVNTSQAPRNAATEWTDSLRADIMRLEHRAIERFGYSDADSKAA